jgi:DNA-binding LacI/PurR family transcriptional regulator
VSQPKNIIGQESVKTVLTLLASKAKKVRRKLEPKLVIRDSSGIH